MSEAVRLQRFLATAGVAARRKAEEMITAGRVTVNGKGVTVLGTKIDPDNDSITVDGEAVMALDKFYVLLNKPKGCITAVTDDRGRPTVMDYLPNVPVPVKPVGRLDFYTEGVLLLTNDGELAAKLLAPASHVTKTYHAKVHGHVTQDQLKLLRKGIELDDGKHHQVHRMFESLGFRVDKLQRVAFANLTFHHLRVGDARALTQQELNQLRDAVGLDHSAVARGRWRATRETTDIPRRARAKARAEAEEAAALAGAAGPGASGTGAGGTGGAGGAGWADGGGSHGARGDGAETDRDEDDDAFADPHAREDDFGDNVDDDELELREAADDDDARSAKPRAGARGAHAAAPAKRGSAAGRNAGLSAGRGANPRGPKAGGYGRGDSITRGSSSGSGSYGRGADTRRASSGGGSSGRGDSATRGPSC